MASTFRRRGKDGKPLARWSYRWTDADGARRSGTGGTDRAATRQIADKKENEAKLVRAGLLEARDLAAAEAGRAPIVEHVEAYRLHLLAKGGTARHAKHIASVVTRLFEAARIKRLPDAGQDTLQAALHRLHQRRSPRTANHALGGVKGLLRWCYTTGRLADPPRWLAAIRPYSERVGRKLVRRALTRPEIDQLLTATATAPDSYSYGPTRARHHRRVLTGPDRVILYRVALGTGFRAEELRSLTAEDFDLTAGTITCRASYTKNGREAAQPISRHLADTLAPWLATRAVDEPVFPLPSCAGDLLKRDLARAGVPAKTAAGVVDFHSLRHTYVSHLIEAGVDPKTVMVLARHSTITLTLDRYAHTDDERKRKAIEDNT